MAVILDGKLLAQKIKNELKEEVQKLKKETGAVPHLVSLLVGEDTASEAYASAQKKRAGELGIEYELKNLPASISQEELVKVIKDLNGDSRINGIMLHKPIPSHLNDSAVTNTISVGKDMEGVTVSNMGKMLTGGAKLVPCTPASVMEHLKSTGVNLRGKEAVVVGRSAIVGKPIALLLLEQNATVTVCHSGTSEANKLPEHLKRADIVVAAMGRPEFIKSDWIKPGAIVIDVGINQVGDKIVGDVEFETAKSKASFITPVPGGVGPLTVVLLMRNGIEAFKAQRVKKDKVEV